MFQHLSPEFSSLVLFKKRMSKSSKKSEQVIKSNNGQHILCEYITIQQYTMARLRGQPVSRPRL